MRYNIKQESGTEGVPENTKFIKPIPEPKPKTPKDTRPLAEQAQDWDEAKLIFQVRRRYNQSFIPMSSQADKAKAKEEWEILTKILKDKFNNNYIGED